VINVLSPPGLLACRISTDKIMRMGHVDAECTGEDVPALTSPLT
jgi:hypothetical protein